MDMSQYLDVFLEESREHLGSLNEKLLLLEKNNDNISALNEIFRAAHTLKGMSSTMGFDDLADLTHHMEDVLSDLKDGILVANSNVVDVLFKCFDRIQIMVDNIELTGNSAYDNTDLIAILENIKKGDFAEANSNVLANQNNTNEIASKTEKVGEHLDTTNFQFNEYDYTVMEEAHSRGFNIYHVKVMIDPDCVMKSVRAFMVFKAIEDEGEITKSIPPAQDLDEGRFENDFELLAITHHTKEDLTAIINDISEVKVLFIQDVNVVDKIDKLASTVTAYDADALTTPLVTEPNQENNQEEVRKAHKIKQTVRVDIERLDNLMNLVGELVMHKGRLEQIATNDKSNELNETIEQIDRVSSDLQSVVMKVRMVPVEQVFNRFPRMVRDLAKDLNKELDFIMEGKETELDRTVIDEIGDPLVHLLRNSVDHGLESAEDRVAAGKPQEGKLILRARHEGNNVYIEVEDDGQGINTKTILNKAIEKGIITAEEAGKMTPEEANNVLFYPGFSTAQAVSDVSGRGVGLDVVRSKIESLNGEIFVESVEGQGTKFRIKLPLTLAIIQALMVAVQGEVYAIPLSSVDETTMITKDDIKMVQNQEVMMMRGNVLPIYRLNVLLETPEKPEEDSDMYVVVVQKAGRQIGLIVDTLIGQQEIVIKSLGKVLGGIPGIAGAIVAGDGNVRLILDIATLF
ncbi:MAG: chemotaxis protein CheA [Syntrophomonadaceae bacterium]|nr:chemotaxis protein CheA [Syntrophomonadaceae bacterium]